MRLLHRIRTIVVSEAAGCARTEDSGHRLAARKHRELTVGISTRGALSGRCAVDPVTCDGDCSFRCVLHDVGLAHVTR